MAVDERGEDVMSDEIVVVDATENSKGGGPLPDWVMNKIKSQHIIALTWFTKMKSLS